MIKMMSIHDLCKVVGEVVLQMAPLLMARAPLTTQNEVVMGLGCFPRGVDANRSPP